MWWGNYSKVPSVDEKESLLSAEEKLRIYEEAIIPKGTFQRCLTALAIAISLIMGFFLGHAKIPLRTWDSQLPGPIGGVQQTWHHNVTFTQPPSAESQTAWSSLIPNGGVINRAIGDSDISNIAVFHQLECMRTIYTAYYDALESPAMSLSNITESDPNAEGLDLESPVVQRIPIYQVRHCIDYVRQSLMCSADTNLETPDPGTHSTTGWNQEKTCRNFEGIKAWAERNGVSENTELSHN